MDLTRDILAFIATNLFNEVSLLIGFITLAGLALQRKPIEDIVGGAIRATIGVLILFIGVDIFSGGLESFQTITASAVGLDRPSADSNLDDFLSSHGGTVALIITIAFVIHLAFVRLLRTRYVYLTGHLMFWMSTVITACLVEAFGTVAQWKLVLAGSVVLACYWTIQPLFIARMTRTVISSDDFGYGHTSASVAWLTGKVAPALRGQGRDVEAITVPKRLSFLRDVNVSTALVIGVIMLVAIAFADKGVVAEQAASYNEDVNGWVWGVIAAFRFSAGIAILLYGVRMFLAEIVPAFTGISEKVIKGSRPALDAPTVFPIAPTAVMVGFISTTLTFLVLMGVFAAVGWFVLTPPMIMLFFVGGGAAVYGNTFGGWKGALLGGVLTGFALAFGQWLGWHLLADTAPQLATLADPDWYLMMLFLLGLGGPLSALGSNAVLVVPVAALVLFTGWLAVLTWLRRRAASTPADQHAQTAGATSGESAGNVTEDSSQTSQTSQNPKE